MRTFAGLTLLAALLNLMLAPSNISAQATAAPDSSGFGPGSVEELPIVCNASDYPYNASMLPELPNQFSFHVEANILEHNRTLIVHQAYDGVNNRERLNILINDTQVHFVIDASNNELFMFPDIFNNTDCRVFPLDSSRFVLALGLVIIGSNGSVQIASPRHFIENINDDTPVRMVGPANIRGIPTMQYQACFNTDNRSYVADYYFTTDAWDYATMANPSNMVLTQIKINGYAFGRQRGRQGNNPAMVRQFNHIYTITGYHSGPSSVPSRMFSIPNGLACAGRKAGIPVPIIPDFFSMSAEQVITTSDQSIPNRVSTIREAFHRPHKLVRIDFYDTGSRTRLQPGPRQLVRDYDSQVQYFIDRHTGNCSVTSLSNVTRFLFEAERSESGELQLESPNQLFFLNNEFNFSYEGVSKVRGVDVDSWVSFGDSTSVGVTGNNITDATIEVFFTQPGYTVVTDRSESSDPVPWRLIVRGMISARNFSNPTQTITLNVSVESDVYDFSASEHSYDVFDVSQCFNYDQYHTLVLLFETPRVGIDFGTFRSNLRSEIMKLTNLKPLQVNNIHIFRSNETHIFVSLHLANLSEKAQVKNRVTGDQAFQILRNATSPLDGSIMALRVPVANNVTRSPIFLSFGRGRNASNCTTVIVKNNTSTCKNDTNSNITNRLNLTDGIVAGIAVALFFGGLIIGLICVLVCFICHKCLCYGGKGSVNVSGGTVKYKKHDDDELDAFS